MTASPITPPDPGQQSLVRLTAGHPLALARLKELMLAERCCQIYQDHMSAEQLRAAHVEIDQAIAEGGR